MKWFDEWIRRKFHELPPPEDEGLNLIRPEKKSNWAGINISTLTLNGGKRKVRKQNTMGTISAGRQAVDLSISKNGIRMQIIPAVGGFAVEFTSYDEKNDRHINHLYVIDDGQDFGEALAKIVNMEMIRG
jgi:hypothetical protein